MTEKRKIYVGRQYRHFKGKKYQVLGIATNSETNEKMVVYQALYGEYRLFVRPYGMFAEKLDINRYPDAAQEFRFELIEDSDEDC